jgi:hypothetical protein
MEHVGGMRIFIDHYQGDSKLKSDAECRFKIEPIQTGKVLRLRQSA